MLKGISTRWWTGSVLAAAFLAGCAATRVALEPDTALKTYPPNEAKTSFSCPAPCGAEWERAEAWLRAHSRWPIRSVSEISIQTEYPRNGEPSYGFSVTRTPDSAGGYTIRMYMGCGNRAGCDLDPARIRNAFFEYLRTGKETTRRVNSNWVSIR